MALRLVTPPSLVGQQMSGTVGSYGPLPAVVQALDPDVPTLLRAGFVPEGAPAFVSSEQTGTGSSQAVAHGLGIAPLKAIAYLTGGPAAYSQPSIVFGTIDATNVNVTVTSGWKFIVIAW